MKKQIGILILFLILFNKLSFSQFGWNSEYDPNNFIGEQLLNKIKSELGEQYEFQYFVLDSMFNKNWVYDEITDPYNQLQGKILFVAYPEYGTDYNQPDSSIIGIFQNGQILWHSDFISLVQVDTAKYGQYYSYSIIPEIFSIKDINNDGLVDILLMTNALWIISWDGTTGTIINDMDPIDRSSKLLSAFDYRLINTNDDDIFEILSYWFEYDSTGSRFPTINIPTRPYVTYGWDGLKYGLWDDVIQIGLNEYPIANRLSGSVKCKIIFNSIDDSSFSYNYTVHNDFSSKQSIQEFVLDNMDETINVDSNSVNWFNYGFDSTGIGWSERFPNQRINPGYSMSGFIIRSKSIPFIGNYYLRADGSRIVYGPDLAKPYDVMTDISNYRTNSYSGLTLIPIDPPDSLIILNFIDTLFYFNQKSFDLNWITNQPTANKYDSLLTIAKTQLQQNNNNAARATLQTVLQELDIDSTDNLTSEAYALLRYNTEYLIEKISLQPLFTLDVINPAMSLVNPGAFTMEVKGTGFTANSVVYFNGNARTTTFGTDTLLTAEILGTDVSVAGNYPVWVSSGTTNSDTVIYKVVNTLPQPVRPVLECVRNNGDGTYTAYFGYKNDNTVSVYIPVGSKNKFTPTPQDRGQTRVFLPGRKYKVFTVNFNGSNLVWTLNGRTSTASSNSAPCN